MTLGDSMLIGLCVMFSLLVGGTFAPLFSSSLLPAARKQWRCWLLSNLAGGLLSIWGGAEVTFCIERLAYQFVVHSPCSSGCPEEVPVLLVSGTIGGIVGAVGGVFLSGLIYQHTKRWSVVVMCMLVGAIAWPLIIIVTLLNMSVLNAIGVTMFTLSSAFVLDGLLLGFVMALLRSDKPRLKSTIAGG